MRIRRQDHQAAVAGGPTAETADPTGDAAYELARLPREVTTAVTFFMREHQVTKSELARRLGVTPGRVSQILSGDENLTLRTLAMVCSALDAHIELELTPNAGRGERAGGRGPGAGVSRHLAC